MNALFRYVGVCLLLVHHFFVWTFASQTAPPDVITTTENNIYDDTEDSDREINQELEDIGDTAVIAFDLDDEDEEIDETIDDIIDDIVDDIPDENGQENDDTDEPIDSGLQALDMQGYSQNSDDEDTDDTLDLGDDSIEDDSVDVTEDTEGDDIIDENDGDPTELDDPDTDIGLTQTSEPSPQLIITEVAFAGIQEWIEIYNPQDTDFVDTIEITGVSASPIVIENMTIPAQSIRIIARQAGVETIADPTLIYSIHPMSMPDSAPLFITLAVDGEVIDTFSASLALMNQANQSTSNRSSLQRTLDDISIVHVSPSQQNYNNNSTMNINPGIVYYTIADLPPAACESRGTDIQIREVFWGSGEYDPYIELFTPGGFAGQITVSGTQIQESFDVFVQQPAGQYHIISLPNHDYTIHPYTSDNQELSLSQELGYLTIYGQDGQVLDKVDIQVKEDGYASYISGQGCNRVGNIIDNFSPGFARAYLSYFPQGAEKIINVTQYITIPGEPQQCDDGGEEPHTETDNDNEGDNNDPIAPPENRDDISLHITHVGYQGPTTGKTITLYMTGIAGLDLAGFYILSNGANKRNLQGFIWEGDPLTLTGSWGFSATQPRCVELMHDDTATFVFSEYCYDPIADSIRTGDIQITDIVYQTAPGSNMRQLHLFVPEGEVDLSQNRYIMINTTKRNLTSYGTISGHAIIQGTFPFPKTQNTCVQLRQHNTLFHSYCYQVAQQNQNNTSESSFNTNWLNYDIQIMDIGYQGPTKEKTITFSLTNGSPVDLSHFHILINGTTKRNLWGTLEASQPLTLTGSLGFSATQARCVELFHKEHLFDTYCYDPAEDKQKEQEERMRKGSITITDIVYETDTNNPDQKILLTASGTDIIFAHDWYLMINTRKFNLKSFGIGSGDIVLTGNFRFPKTIETCVSIGQYDTLFDTYCYNQKQTKEQTQMVYTGISLEIVAALPNPIGPDAGKEWLDIVLHNPNTVDLSQGFSILINGRTKRSIAGQPQAGEIYRLTGSFTLPNTASCISILYHDTMLDTFCYPQTKEGIIYNKNSQTLLALTDSELSLLNATRLTRFNNRLCLTLSDVTIKCRAIPAGRLASRQMQELQLSRNYISTIHDYLYNHRQVLYFNTDLVHYKTLYDSSKKDISVYQFTRQYGSERIPIADFQTRFQLQYKQPLLQQVQSQVASKIFGPKLTQNYTKAKSIYYSQP